MEKLYDYFEDHKLNNRTAVRFAMEDILNEFPELNQQLVEGYFAKYKQQSLPQSDDVKVVAISDLHVPFHNMDFINNIIKFLKDYQPDKIVLVGDIVDFYDLSNFDKNPKRVGVLQKELDIVNGILMLIRIACPNSEIIYVCGNHEDRLRKFIWRNPSVASLRDLKLERLLRFSDIGNIQLVDSYALRGITFTHGSLVRKHSSYSSKAEYDKHLESGISGHTHRLGTYHKTTTNRSDSWSEIGCCCTLSPEYIHSQPDWQNGFAIIQISGDIKDIHLVKATNNSFIANMKVYK